MRRIVGLILIVALTLFATLAETLRNNLWISYRNYNSPYLADLPAGTPRFPTTQRVVLVLVRGLRLEMTQQMPTLSALRSRGADIVVQHRAPTYRLPVWTTLFSGADAETHGVTTNNGIRGSPNTLFQQMMLSGQASALIGSQTLGDAFGGDVQRFEAIEETDVATRDDDAIRAALEVQKDTANPARLVCVELTAIEATQQNNPATLDAAVSVTDARVKTLLDALDLNTTTLIVMSDRGLTAQGADGGLEPDVALTPMIMAGAGVAAGNQVLINDIDVAPTLTALTGALLPLYTQGQPVFTVLDLSKALDAGAPLTPSVGLSETVVPTETLAPLPALQWASALQLTTFYESWSEVVKQPRFAAELLRAHQDGIRAGNSDAYTQFVSALNTRASAARSARMDAERGQRIPLVAGAALFLLAVLGLILLSTHRWQPVIGAAAYMLLWFALFTLLREHRFSLSMFANGDPSTFFTALARDSALFMGGVSVFVALTTGHHEDGLDAIATVMLTLLLIVAVQMAQAVWFYLQWGNTFTGYLPDSGALVAALVALTQASALSLRIVPELPNLPVPLLIAFFTLAVYGLVREREKPGAYRRLR
jgi:hypothetical protein